MHSEDWIRALHISRYREELLTEYDFSQEEYENYAAMYKNVMEELKDPKDKTEKEDPVMDDYDLIAYSKMRVDFEYIVELLQGLVNYLDQTHDDFQDAIFAKNILALREISKEFAEPDTKGRILESLSTRCVMMRLTRKSGHLRNCGT